MDYRRIGQVLKTCRERVGYSQLDMALNLSRSQSCISKIEAGKRYVDLETFFDWLELTRSKEFALEELGFVDFTSIKKDAAGTAS